MSTNTATCSSSRTKRSVACLQCRRQKLRCDGSPGVPCSRCRHDSLECTIRPRANAAITASDLQWQQSVEQRLKVLQDQLSDVRSGTSSSHGHQYTSEKEGFRIPSVASLAEGTCPFVLPARLNQLRSVLVDPFDNLKGNVPYAVTVEEAALLWDLFYNNLALYHGFIPHPVPTSPSPLLLASIATASASRTSGHLAQHHTQWLEIFHQRVPRLMHGDNEHGWDDVVALCIARTWFWEGTAATSGLIYGHFLSTLNPNTADLRSQRVWNFLQTTVVSHCILDLSPQVVPDIPPSLIPARQPVHIFFEAFNDLFGILGVLSRSLTSFVGIIPLALDGFVYPRVNIPFAETAVLRSSGAELTRWKEERITHLEPLQPEVPGDQSPHRFLADLVTIYHQAATVILSAYTMQTLASDQDVVERAAKEYLRSATSLWSMTVVRWPTFLLNTLLISAIAVPLSDELVGPTFNLIQPLSTRIPTTSRKLFRAVERRLVEAEGSSLHGSSGQSLPAETLEEIGLFDGDLDLSFLQGASDFFWPDMES